MGRAKRSRKTRSANRRAKRFAKLSERVRAVCEEQRERLRARKIIESSDAPEEVKTVLCMLVDPLDGIRGMVQRIGREAGVDLAPKEEEVPPWLEE